MIKIRQPRQNVVNEKLNLRSLFLTMIASFQSCSDGATSLVTENYNQRSQQVDSCVLHAANNSGSKDVPCHSHHEDFSQTHVEYQLGWNSRVAATNYGRVGALTLCES